MPIVLPGEYGIGILQATGQALVRTDNQAPRCHLFSNSVYIKKCRHGGVGFNLDLLADCNRHLIAMKLKAMEKTKEANKSSLKPHWPG
jgi:hypothetical protein